MRISPDKHKYMLTDEQIRSGKEVRHIPLKSAYLSGPSDYDSTVARLSAQKGGQTVGYAYEEQQDKINLLVLVNTGTREMYYTATAYRHGEGLVWL